MKKMRDLLILLSLAAVVVLAGCEMGSAGSSDTYVSASNKVVISDVTASASSDDGNSPSNTLDGTLDTRWSANGDGEYITYDLGSSKEVTHIKIALYKGDSRTSDFEIWAGDNTSSLSQILALTTSSGDTLDLESYDVTDVTARYVRIVGYGNSSNTWNSITEVEIEDNNDDVVVDPVDPDPVDPVEEGQLAIDSTSSSSDDGNVSDNTVDGDLDTRWSANGDGQYVTLDLGSTKTVAEVQIALYKGDSRTSTFEIWAGDSTSSLSQILDLTTSSGGSLDLEAYDVTDVSARYVRIIGYGNSSNTWNSITEVQVWGSESSDGGTDPETVDPVDPVDPGTAEYPTDLIPSITDWKLTLPVDEDGNDSSAAYLAGESVSERNTDPWEIVQTDLIDFEYQPYFQVDNGGVRFRGHCAGATTSGSKYPRSELRQEYDGGDNYWSVDDYQYLNTRLEVSHTPVEKPEVCITQIHGPEDEPMRVQYHTEKGVYLVWNESNKDYDGALDYTIGDVLDITVTVQNGDITCDMINEATGETYTKTWTSNDSTGYFKVGCYTQSTVWLNEYKGDSYEDEDIDAYGEVIVYSIDLIEN